ERAKALLRRGDLSVTEVCFEVGCTSLGSRPCDRPLRLTASGTFKRKIGDRLTFLTGPSGEREAVIRPL
ncbi:hypothetical protein ABZ834_28560, partial [Streptomyces sp. NPDC047141]